MPAALRLLRHAQISSERQRHDNAGPWRRQRSIASCIAQCDWDRHSGLGLEGHDTISWIVG